MYPNGLRTPGLENVNLTLNRQFLIKEGVRLGVVAEATNLLN